MEFNPCLIKKNGWQCWEQTFEDIFLEEKKMTLWKALLFVILARWGM